MLAHVPSFGRNPRGSPDFLAYPVPKACLHVLGTRVPRRLGVARSASSPKAAQALGCSLTPGLRISFGRVTCMARAASVPGLWALGFLLLACVCGWVRVAVGRGFCLPLPVVAGVLGGCVWARFVVLSLFCRLFVVFVVGLWCGPAFGTSVVSCAFPLPPAVSGSGVRCGRPGLGCAPPFLAGLSGFVFLRFFVFFFFFPVAGCPCPGPCGLSPVSFLLGAAGFFFFFFFFACFGVPFFRWAAVAGLVLPVLAGWSPCACLGVLSSVPSGWGVWPPSVLLVGGLVAVGCFRAPAPPPPPPFFFFFFFFSGGGPAGLFLPLPSLGWRLLCGWCVVWLVPRHSWQRFLCATPRHSWLGFAAGGCGRSPPLLAGVCRRRWCLVCGVGVLVGLWLVCGVVGPSPLLAEVPVCYSPPLLAGFRFRWCWAGPATPGWGPLAALLCGVWCVAVVCWWGCGWCVVWLVPRHSWRRFLCATPRHSWLGFAAGGGGRSPPLLAGVRLRRWCVVCGVWCVAVVCGWGCGWCVVWLVPRHSWRWFLCGTPRHSWLGFASGGGGRSPPLLAGVRWRRCCVPCGVWRWCVGGVVAGVWCGWSLATPGGGSCVLLPATPGWVSLPVVVGGPRHSWLGSACGGGVWCVVCGVWRWCVGGVVAGVWCGWSLATPGGGTCVLLPATPGWVSLPVVVGGPRHSWLGSVGGVAVWCVVCGGGVLVGLWLVCGVVGPSPLLAEVPVCYSPPLLAGFRCRWWWAVPATPGWGPLAALLCGVWCVAVVCWWGCGWCVVWLVPRHSWRRFLCATPRHSWLGFAAGGGGRSPPLLAGVRWRRCCVVCGVWRWCVGGVVAGVWCGWSLATPGGGSCVLLPATPGWVSLPVVVGGPRLSWLGSACGGGVWCVVCGVWRWCVGGVVAGVWCGWSLATPGGGSCVLLPATPGWVSLPVVVGGPRHSWLGSFGGGGVRVLLGRVGRAGLPGALWCASPFPLAALSFCFAWPPPGWGCPPLLRCCCRSSLAGVCGVWVGCCLAPVRVPWFFACCARCPGLWHPAAVAAWHLSVCPGCGRRRASLACLVAPRGAPRLVRSGRSRCSGRLSRRRGAFPHPGSLRPRLYWAAARGTRRPAENRAHCACRWPPPRQGRWALRVVPVRGPAMGLSLAGPSGVGLGLRALRWLACADPVTDASGFPYRPSFDGGLGRCTGAVSCGRRHLPLRVGGRHARVPCVFACACFPGRVGRAGLPGAFWCASPFPLAALSFCFAWPPPGWGCPSLFRCCCLSPLVVFLGLLLLGSRLVCVLRLAVGCSLVVAPPPRPPLCLGFSSLLLVALVFFFFFSSFSVRPRCLRLSLVSGPGCPGPRRLRCLFCWPSASRLSVRLSLFRAFPLAVGCSRVVAAPPPPRCVPRFSFLPLGAVCRVVLCVPRCGAVLRRAAARCVARCCAGLCCVALVWCRCFIAPCPLALPVALGPCALRRCVLRCSPALCALCVLSWRGGACCAFPVLSVLCGAVLRCAGALALCCSCGACCCWRLVLWCAAVCCAVSCGVPWCGAGSGGLWLSAGGVFRCRCPCLAAWSASLCLVWFAVVPCFPVSCSVVLCCRVVLWCCALLSCCGAVGACFALLWAVVLCCVVLLVGCAAFGPVVVSCVLWCSFPRAVCSLSPPLCALRCLVVLAVVPCFPVSCAVPLCCRVVLCCRALLSFCGAVCVCFALLRPVVRRLCRLRCCWCLVLWRVPVRCGVSLGVLRCGGAALVCRGVLLCCALSCGVLRSVPCPAVPCCPAVLCWLAVLCGCLRCWCLFCPLFFC